MSSNPSVVDAYLDELKLRLGVRSDAELGKKLSLGKSTFATWRRRGAIPFDVYAERFHPDPIDYFRLVNRHVATVLESSEAGFDMITYAAVQVGADVGKERVNDWAEWLATNRTLIFYELVKQDSSQRNDEQVSDDYVNRRLVALSLKARHFLAPETLKRLRAMTTG